MANVHFLLRRLEEKKTPLIVFSFLILYSLLFYFCQRTGKWVGGSRVEKDVLTPYKFAAIVCFLFCRRLCVERGLKCLISPRNSIPTLEDDIINPHTRLNPLGLFGGDGSLFVCKKTTQIRRNAWHRYVPAATCWTRLLLSEKKSREKQEQTVAQKERKISTRNTHIDSQYMVFNWKRQR